MEMMDLLDTLQVSLKQNEDLETVWQHFYKLTALADVFNQSQSEPLPRLTEALSDVLVDSFAETIPVRDFVALRLTGSGFYHGMSSARGLMVTYFYFTEINAGVVAVPNPPLSEQIELRRFSLNPDEEYAELITNPPCILH